MQQYKDLVTKILTTGEESPDRTGTGTKSIFGHQMRFNLAEGFPLVTMKQTFWRGAFAEMLWFLRGYTNIKWLQDQGVRFWNEFATEWGDIGPMYGHQWCHSPGGHDQIAELIESLKNDPHSRRHIVSAWDIEKLPLPGIAPNEQARHGHMALAPCHVLAQFYVSTDGKLSCQLYQRSADVFLGLPMNIAGYALLTHLLALHCGYEVGDLVWTGGDCHLYLNHLEQAKEMLKREPRPLPELNMFHPQDTLLWEVQPDDLEISSYRPHPTIKAEVSV